LQRKLPERQGLSWSPPQAQGQRHQAWLVLFLPVETLHGIEELAIRPHAVVHQGMIKKPGQLISKDCQMHIQSFTICPRGKSINDRCTFALEPFAQTSSKQNSPRRNISTPNHGFESLLPPVQTLNLRNIALHITPKTKPWQGYKPWFGPSELRSKNSSCGNPAYTLLDY
jgi:hypothetical protein